MLSFLGHPGNLPFAVSLYAMLGIAALEGMSLLLGGGLSHWLDSWFHHDVDVDVDVDLDVDADAASTIDLDTGHDFVSHALGWLHVGAVPVLVVLVLFLTSFALCGFTLQSLASALTGYMIPASLAWIPALAGALPAVRFTGGRIARWMPKEETSAVSQETFVGRIAVIVLGVARAGEPAQARLRDEHGRTHYVLVEPDMPGEELPAGSDVLIVKLEGARFRAIRPPSPALVDAVRR
jgi:hypothetical protein